MSDDARFFGRRAEALDISRQLQSGQIRASLGIRKIGKTSILNRILKESRASHGSACVMLDCSKDDLFNQNAVELLYSIGEAIQNACGNGTYYAEVGGTRSAKGGSLLDARKQVAKAVESTNATVILFFDEVDYITPGSPTASELWSVEFNTFWRNLRVIVQECARIDRRLSLFISGVSSRWFQVESIDGIENAALAFIPEEYLSPLASAASAAMIRTLAKVAGLTFDDESAEWIGDVCGNMPYWTRKACSYIHRNIDVRDRPCLIPKDNVIALVKEFVEVEGAAIAEVALNHLFRVHEELFVHAKSVLEGQSRNKNEPMIATLIRYGILSERNGVAYFGSLMIESGMRLYATKQTQPSSVEPSAPTTTLNLTIDEWADELASINGSRNKLERRLRSLVLNFVRFSALQDKNGKTTSDRLHRAVEKVRLEKLKHLTSEDLMEKLLWTELVRLIDQNWELFQAIFGDKTHFLHHANVVNERYDAHAKIADNADLAYYRRSLGWLEDRVQRASA